MSDSTLFFNDANDENEDILLEMLKGQGLDSTTPLAGKEVITVYLAGPIEQDLQQETPHSVAWREDIKSLFDEDPEFVWDVRDPNSGKTDGVKYIKNESNSHYYNPHILFKTDLKNVSESDFIIANISQFGQGFGTPFELGFAYANATPIICICDEDSKIKNHPFVKESTEVFVSSLQEAVNVVKFLVLNEN